MREALGTMSAVVTLTFCSTVAAGWRTLNRRNGNAPIAKKAMARATRRRLSEFLTTPGNITSSGRPSPANVQATNALFHSARPNRKNARHQARVVWRSSRTPAASIRKC